MAKNDMEVIMYKILRYLYECMKTGKTPDLADIMWNCKMFDIPKAYWLSICADIKFWNKSFLATFALTWRKCRYFYVHSNFLNAF